MSKMTDETCLVCCNYDTCDSQSSENCKKYEYYKCISCIDRVIENDEVPRCFRGGIPCEHIRMCSNERRE